MSRAWRIDKVSGKRHLEQTASEARQSRRSGRPQRQRRRRAHRELASDSRIPRRFKSAPRNHLNHNNRSPSVPTQRELAEKALARRNARFVADWRDHSHALNSHQVARILEAAERLQVRTTAKGRINGAITRGALLVLRALATRFMRKRSGLCCPSYRAIMDATGLCKATVAEALACLESAGILTIVRRLCRRVVERRNPRTGLLEFYNGTVQDTSLYSLHMPGAWTDHMTAPPRGARYRFPVPRQLQLLRAGRLTWSVQPSLGHREETTRPPTPNGMRPLAEATAALRAAIERAPRAGFQGSGGAL
jgi:hypothetical protein